MKGKVHLYGDHVDTDQIIPGAYTKTLDVEDLAAHVFEYLAYSDYNVDQDYWENKVDKMSFGQKAEFKVKMFFSRMYERTIKKSLSRSGLYKFEMLDIPKVVEYGSKFFDPRFTGEAFLSVGGFYKDILHSAHGIISIGPFACMQARVAESVISANTDMNVKRELDKAIDGRSHVPDALSNVEHMPFLAIESDGNPFPQILDARLEVFAIQVERLYKRLKGEASPVSLEPPVQIYCHKGE